VRSLSTTVQDHGFFNHAGTRPPLHAHITTSLLQKEEDPPATSPSPTTSNKITTTSDGGLNQLPPD